MTRLIVDRSPKMAATRLKRKSPINPQLMAPMMTRTMDAQPSVLVALVSRSIACLLGCLGDWAEEQEPSPVSNYFFTLVPPHVDAVANVPAEHLPLEQLPCSQEP